MSKPIITKRNGLYYIVQNVSANLEPKYFYWPELPFASFDCAADKIEKAGYERPFMRRDPSLLGTQKI